MKVNKYIKKTLGICFYICFLLIINTDIVFASGVSLGDNFEGALKGFVAEYKYLIGGVVGFSVLTSIGIFVYHFCQLASSSSNPQKRSEAISNLLTTGVCLALLGAVPLIIVLLFYTVN